MTQTHRLVASLLCAAAIGIGSVAVAAPAQAATVATYNVTQSGFSTLTACKNAEARRTSIVINRGGQIYKGASCGWLGKDLRYGYTFSYRTWNGPAPIG